MKSLPSSGQTLALAEPEARLYNHLRPNLCRAELDPCILALILGVRETHVLISWPIQTFAPARVGLVSDYKA